MFVKPKGLQTTKGLGSCVLLCLAERITHLNRNQGHLQRLRKNIQVGPQKKVTDTLGELYVDFSQCEENK